MFPEYGRSAPTAFHIEEFGIKEPGFELFGDSRQLDGCGAIVCAAFLPGAVSGNKAFETRFFLLVLPGKKADMSVHQSILSCLYLSPGLRASGKGWS